MNAIVSEKGQVTIPKALRVKLGLRAGCVLRFSDENGVLHARKFLTQDPIHKWRGRGKIEVDGRSITVVANDAQDYISLTDIAKYKTDDSRCGDGEAMTPISPTE